MPAIYREDGTAVEGFPRPPRPGELSPTAPVTLTAVRAMMPVLHQFAPFAEACLQGHEDALRGEPDVLQALHGAVSAARAAALPTVGAVAAVAADEDSAREGSTPPNAGEHVVAAPAALPPQGLAADSASTQSGLPPSDSQVPVRPAHYPRACTRVSHGVLGAAGP